MTHRFALPTARHSRQALAGVSLACLLAASQAQIVTIGPNPQALPGCPFSGQGYLCVVEGAAQVLGPVGSFDEVRLGQLSPGYNNGGGLVIGSGALLNLNGATNPAAMVVGADVGRAGSLSVVDGGQLNINAQNGPGGLLLGLFAAPNDAPLGLGGTPQASTTAFIANGGAVSVTKQGGAGISAAVGVGYGLGSNSSLVLDGGIGGFGSAALGATLTTGGNLSIGRQGTGAVDLFRNATVNANTVYVASFGPTGHGILGVGYQSTLNAGAVYAGIGLNGLTGQADPNSSAHGTAWVDVGQFGFLNGALILGTGGTLTGYGHVGSLSNYGGVIGPGHSPGTLTIDGAYTDVGGHLEIEFGLSGQDLLVVNGPVSMNGTNIDFHFIEGFVPQAGFRFDFLNSKQVLADLQNLHFSYTGLAAGLDFVVETGADGVLTFIARNAGVALPLPATLPLALLGLAGVGWSRRRSMADGRPSRGSSMTGLPAT